MNAITCFTMSTARAFAIRFLVPLLLIIGTEASIIDETPLVDRNVTNLNLTDFVENKVYTKRTHFAPVSDVIINVTNVPEGIAFILLQVHAYQYNVTLSYDGTQLNKVSNRSVFGSNIGVYIDTKSKTNAQVFLRNDNVHIVEALLVAVAYGKYAPIPGGCNMEFDMEIAPYQQVIHRDSMVVVDAQPASAPTSNGKQASCEKHPVHHEMYRMYLREQDFTQSTYFTGIEKMLNINDIILNGEKIPSSLTTSPMRRVYSAYTGTGSVYAVVATYENHSAAYVPTFSYACSPLLYPDSCQLLNDSFSKVICAIAFFLGVFSVFLGHRYFRMDMILPVSLTGGVIGYTVAGLSKPIGRRRTGYRRKARFVISANIAFGLVAAIIATLSWFSMWCCSPRRVFQMMVTNITLGYFCASIAYYNISAGLTVMENDWIFWPTFVCVMLLVSVLLTIMSCFSDAITCTMFGSFMMILPIDYFTESSLKYIIINVIRRQTVSGFNLAVILPPCQDKEISLAILWACLALVRITKQFCGGIFCLPWLCRGRNILSERTPLLSQ